MYRQVQNNGGLTVRKREQR